MAESSNAGAELKTFHVQSRSSPEQRDIYGSYDPMMGLKTAAFLGSFLMAIIGYIIYKTGCRRSKWTSSDRLFIENYKRMILEAETLANEHAAEDEAAAAAATKDGGTHVGPRAAIVTLAMRPKNLGIQRSDAYDGLGSKVKDGALGPGLGLLSLPYSLAATRYRHHHEQQQQQQQHYSCHMPRDGEAGTPPGGDNCHNEYYDDSRQCRPRLSIDDATSRACSDDYYVYCPSSNASYGEPDLTSICSSSSSYFHGGAPLPLRRHSENATLGLLRGGTAAGGARGRLLTTASGQQQQQQQQQLLTDRMMMLETMMKRAEGADGGRQFPDHCTPLLLHSPPPFPSHPHPHLVSDCCTSSISNAREAEYLFSQQQQQQRYAPDEGGGGIGNGYRSRSAAAAASSSVFTSAVEVHVNHHYNNLSPTLLTPSSAGCSPVSSPFRHHLLHTVASLHHAPSADEDNPPAHI